MTYAGLKTQNGLQIEIDKTQAPPGLPALFEYTYYALLAYATLGGAWGLVIPSLGGVLLAVLAVACLLSLGSRALEVCAPITWALCCGISVIAVELTVHSEGSLDAARPFTGWLLMLVIAQTLSSRQGFLHRFALAALGIGLCALPFVTLYYDGSDAIRARADQTSVSNPNALALWFGFCFVYFLVLGIETKYLLARVVSWSMATGCLYIVAITVSRGPLLGAAVATIITFRRRLKGGFVPLLSLMVFGLIVYETGIFDQVTNFYFARGTIETGRGIVMPLAFQRFLDSPWIGVGLDRVLTPIRWDKAIAPHNGVLYIALACGVIPLACFLAYLLRAGLGALHADAKRFPHAPFLLPLVTFALLEIMILDTAFMSPWTIVVLSLAIAAGVPPRGRRSTVSRMGRNGSENVWNSPASRISQPMRRPNGTAASRPRTPGQFC